MSMVQRRRLRRCVLIACITIWLAAFSASHVPQQHVPALHVTDVVLHAVGFFVLASLFSWMLASRGVAPFRRVVAVILVMAAYAAFDELTQPLVNRTAAWGDWTADVLGAAAAAVLWSVISLIVLRVRRRESLSPNPGR